MVQGGWQIPSSYFAALSSVWFIVAFFLIEDSVEETLEKNIESLVGTSAESMKLVMTGNQSDDMKTFSLLRVQQQSIQKAAEMLQDLKEGVEWPKYGWGLLRGSHY